MNFVCRESESYQLVQLSGNNQLKTLLYRTSNNSSQHRVFDLLNCLEEDHEGFQPSLASRTQKLIAEYREEELEEKTSNQVEVTGVRQLVMPVEGAYAILLVELGQASGLILVNLLRSRKDSNLEFVCPIRTADYDQSLPQVE